MYLISSHLRFLLLAVALVAIDQLTKWYVLSDAVQERVFGFITIEAVRNAGSIFSLALPEVFILTVQAVVLGLLGYAYARARRAATKVAVIGFIAGGVSNGADRLWHGAVIDIFTLGSLTFNIADGIILSSLALYIATLLREWIKGSTKSEARSTKQYQNPKAQNSKRVWVI